MYVIDLQLCPTIRATVRYLPRPGLMELNPAQEIDGMLVYSADLPALPNPIGDITKQHLTVDASGARIIDTDIDLGIAATPEFKVADDAEVVMQLTYVDDAGNISTASVRTFIAKDTIAPAQPGELTVNLLREEP